MIEMPDMTSRYEVPGANPQPASLRPGETDPIGDVPDHIDHGWWDRIHGTMDLGSLLSAALRIRRVYREPDTAQEWSQIMPGLRLAREMLLEELDHDPDNVMIMEYYHQVEYALTGRHRRASVPH
jgi:hypothetical protein